MNTLYIKNPFGAPVYYRESVSSTFDAARLLAAKNEPHGTVITADFQEAGRGRLDRPWAAEKGKNLLFTILFRYGDFASIPEALTLKTGLAVALAIEDLVPSLAGTVKIKWPNDVMLDSRKAAGILTETDGSIVYIGIGVNVAQKDFPIEYGAKAGSIVQMFPRLDENLRFPLLEKILSRLYAEIEQNGNWRGRLDERLYKKGETVTFAYGAADSTCLIKGTLSGIGSSGEIRILPEGEINEREFITGELRVYG